MGEALKCRGWFKRIGDTNCVASVLTGCAAAKGEVVCRKVEIL